jgi:tRNA dimethylallyltransferase
MNMQVEQPKVVVICGPTCTGKTVLAIQIAQAVNGEIISADSMQVYRHMNIGTAKPTHDEQACVPHYMIDIVNPDEHFDAAQFAMIAGSKITQLHEQGKISLVVGGTGLYIKALLYGLSRARPADSNVLLRLKHEASAYGTDALYQRLRECDMTAASKIHPNDTFRLIRALEIFEATGKTMSSFHQQHRFKDKQFNCLQVGLTMDRNTLYDRINRRVDMMIDKGLLNEVQSLLSEGYDEKLKAMQSIGYRHMADYIQKRCSWEETVTLLKRDTRRYAKRQMTWFRYDTNILWREPCQADDVIETIQRFIKE